MCNKSVTSFTIREVVGMNFVDTNSKSEGYITLCAHCANAIRYNEIMQAFYSSIRLNQRLYDRPLRKCHLCDVSIVPASESERDLQRQMKVGVTKCTK